MPKWATGSKSSREKSLNRGANPPPQPPEATGSTAIRIQEFRGPLPPPHDLREYEQVVEGAAERIVQMAEREQRVGHELAIEGARTAALATRRAQFVGLVCVMSALGAAVGLGYLGHAVAAGAVGTTTVLGLATAFLATRKTPPAGRPIQSGRHPAT